ncbi:MAG: hydroxymethylbilane synthase, partial [Pseudomonadota bacterium]|nr:hydroxymethylbilane synthase [Pseudomonadota bacterium]
MTRQITIGTRASPLALAQTEQIVTELQGAGGLPAGAVSVRKISTKGDEILDRTLAEIGGKGLFTDELNAGLRDGSIDLAVHSLKDLPTAETPGLFTAAIPVREDPRDILIVATPNGPTPGSL